MELQKISLIKFFSYIKNTLHLEGSLNSQKLNFY